MTNSSIDFLIRETKDIVLDLQRFVKTNQDNSNPVKFSIIVKKKIKTITQKTRNLIFSKEIQIKEKINEVNNLIPTIKNILNMFPSEHPNLFLDLSIILNYLILNIAVLGRQNDIWRMSAFARILANMLVQMPTMKELPEIPPQTDSTYVEQTRRIRNSLTMTIGTYFEVLVGSYELDKETGVEWTNLALHHIHLYKKFISDINLHAIDFDSMQGEEVFMHYRFFLMPLWNGLAFLLNIYRVFGSKWPDHLDTKSLSSSPGPDLVKTYGKFVKEKFNSVISKIYDNYSNGLLDKNDNPDGSEHIATLKIIENFIDLYELQFDNFNSIFPLETNSVDLIVSLVKKDQVLLNKIDEINPDSNEERLSSTLLSYYFDLYELMITHYGLKAIISKDLGHLKKIKKYKQEIHDNLDKAAQLYYLFVKFEVSTKLRNNDTQYLLDYIRDLDELKSHFEFKHRELLDIYQLEYIIYQAMNMDNEANKILQKIQMKIDKLTSRDTTRQQLYDDFLSHLNEGGRDKNIVLSPFDYHTWILEYDFNINAKKLFYFPISAQQFKFMK